jgi:two-component system OmpR family sensor kinase
MKRLPIRLRLVAGFSAAMLVVLTAAAVFVYWRVEYALDRGLDGDLDRATSALEKALGPDGFVAHDGAVTATGAVYQVLDADGNVIAHSGTSATTPPVSPSRLPEAGGDPETLNVGRLLPASDRPLRILVTPTEIGGQPAYLAVGVRRDHRDEALRELLAQLTVAVLGALIVTSVVGYILARSALAPVERYRRRAESIAAGAIRLRLDVPDEPDDEVVRLGRTLNDMLAALERALESERRFVDDASHELRTPLTLIKGRVQAAQRRPRSVEEHEEVLAELLTDIERLTQLATQLLELRIPDHQATICDVATVVNRVVGRHCLPSPVDEEPVVAAASEDIVERIVENLVANALLHGRPPVTVTVATDGGWVVLTVQDGGPGMDAVMLGSATDRFARSDEARSRPGSGLGLAIVRSLTESTGGQLRLCSHGQHRRFGADVHRPCSHDPHRMTATVLLPARADQPHAARRR